MNKPILRLYGLVLVLFAALIFATSWWTVFGADDLRSNPNNRRALLEQARVKRGTITARDGTVLARSVPAPGGLYSRTYPSGDLFSQTIGYSFINFGRAGLEQYRNPELTGQRPELSSIIDQLMGKKAVGDEVQTNLDPQAQRVAIEAMAGRKGSIVALEPATGKIRVMVSVPGFDPNSIPDDLSKLNTDNENSPLLNRATQAQYPPGSTFKVVTATAAIDSGKYSPDSIVDGSSPKEISGVPLSNSGGAQFGRIDLTTALTNSVNTVWAEVGEKVGIDTMAEYMKRYGFYAKPPLDYPANQRIASGERGANGELLSPTSNLIDVGRMAIGQDKLTVTPLQMAMVASAVANGGVLVAPRITDRIIDSDGRVRNDIKSTEVIRVMKASTAQQITKMMSNVVREGTGTAAALSGIAVAGKTGTAEKNPALDLNQVWFIGFAPADNPTIAIAVTIEDSVGGQGGTVAAPVARQVLEALL
ncbi:MAG: penicillin-binding transpeptidase domain-containing protein [Solirubrobacterales bacterium]|nr:penicillin-binding transpeptidase domain-containing protein [Solirubrobacterales bacterium]